MYFKLARRNMHRSMKDYAIYFITLIFSIALFYTFNTVGDQKVLLDLDGTWDSAFKSISAFMSITSVFVVFVLAFLILYSNNFLIRRRKKELGIYLTLGMENRGVSKILFIETLILGTVSLGIGLITGVFASQILSIFTANLFDVELQGFIFIFSKYSCIKTVIAFGAIYLLVAIFNIFTIGKIKLINLINADKKNESIKVRNPLVSFFVFLVSIAFIGIAYYLAIDIGVAVINRTIIKAMILGIVGTFLFFISLSGFLLTILKKSKGIYFKNLNMFLIRQINSKINTASISISFICLMLFLAICMLSSGLSLNKAMNKNIADLTPYNMTFYSYSAEDIPEILKKNNVDLSEFTDSYHFLKTYTDELHYSDLLTDELMDKGKIYYPINQNTNVEFMKISDLNKELRNLGKEEISLKEDEFLIVSDVTEVANAMKNIDKDNKTITVRNKEYKARKNPVLDLTFYNALIKGTMATVVLDDVVVDKMIPFNSFINFNFKGDKKDMESKIDDIVNDINKEKRYFYSASETSVVNSSKGTGVTVSFIGIYIGVIFIIASAAVLAIRQLSSTDDNIQRYNLLKKIGTEEEEIYKAVKAEIGIYFGMPLILAIVHSIVGLKLANDVIGAFGSGTSILKLMIVSAIFIGVIYGTYYLGTYICAKSIIKKKA